MNALFIIIFMVVVGAIIGGVTNIIAIRMLFHPFKPYYIFKMRIPFTPGLIPKRREEIATKIGQVIEEHLLTETLIHNKLQSDASRQAIESMLFQQVNKLKGKHATVDYFAKQLNINLDQVLHQNLNHVITQRLNEYYTEHQNDEISTLLPSEIVNFADNKVEQLTPLLSERAKKYLSSDKGYQDISNMLDTFFNEKGKIVGMLQMFMTKESIAERIQHELIRLTSHPKAQAIVTQVIHNEYETLKHKGLSEVVSENQFEQFSASIAQYIVAYGDSKRHMPVSEMAPQFIEYLEQRVVGQLTDMIIAQASKHLSTIMQKINLRAMIEEQINTFDLDYIERLIIEIANKELKLIMSLGFILGGIIGFFQGIVAIFV